MKRTEIDALVRAHRGRARPVASLHVLRQNKIEADDQAFLCEYARELAIPDLLVWRTRCAPGFTGAVIRELARIAIEEPSVFEHELLAAPRFALAEEEWVELVDLTRGKVSPALLERILARGVGTVPHVAAHVPINEQAAEDTDFAAFLESTLGDFEPTPPMTIPQGFVDASMTAETILERARHAWSAEERMVLLEWLTARGLPRKPLVEIATTAIRAGEHDARMRAWLAGQLGTRAGWEAHGLDIVLALIDRNALAELSELVALVWSGTPGAKMEQVESNRRGLLDAMMTALALALIHLVREALTASMPERAMVLLSALACLDLPTRLSRSIHDLLRAPNVQGDVQALIEFNVRLVKYKKGRNASLEDIIAAIHCLVDMNPEA